MKVRKPHFAIRISVVYVIIAGLWITTTDRLAFYLFKDPETLRIVSTYKGYFFVVFTGGLLFLMAKGEMFRRYKIELRLNAAKLKAEESDKLKSAFLANMSHEIRTPMNAILGFSSLLDTDNLNQEKRRKFIDLITKRGNDLLLIIDDLLDISRIEANQIKLIYNEDNIYDLLEDLKTSYNIQLSNDIESNVVLEITNTLPKENARIISDFGRIKQILSNLIGNACKFTHSGRIEFGCKVQGKELLFYVKDTGIGISPYMKEQIFERFRQGEDLFVSKKYSGTGLGLSISKGLVELLKGKIWVESTLGVGSEFYFTIPYSPIIKTESIPELALIPNKYNWETKTILVIEDDQYNCEYLAEILEETRVNLLFVHNATLAIQTYNNNRDFDLVLLDIRLPDMNGYKVIKELLSMNPKLNVIAQTSYANEETKTACLEAGFTNYISKPIHADELIKMIELYF